MSDPGASEYKIGDVVGGYVLTESGWQPVGTGAPTREYQIGDQANGYVLTETGWQPLPAAPTQEYKVGDVAGGYIMTESGWVLVPGAQAGIGQPGPSVAPSGGGPIRPGSSNKVLYWILGGAAAVVLLVVLGVVLAVRGSDSAPTTSGSASTAPPTTTSTTRPPSPTSSATQGVQSFAFGQTATVTQRVGRTSGDVTVGAPVPFAPTSQFDKPERGQFVYFPVTVTATGTETFSANRFDFAVIMPDGQRLREAFIADLPANAPAELTSSNLNPGEKVSGSVAFDVPPNTPLKIAYAPSGQIVATWG